MHVETTPELDSDTDITKVNSHAADEIAPFMSNRQLMTVIKKQGRMLESQGKMLQHLLDSSKNSRYNYKCELE